MARLYSLAHVNPPLIRSPDSPGSYAQAFGRYADVFFWIARYDVIGTAVVLVGVNGALRVGGSIFHAFDDGRFESLATGGQLFYRFVVCLFHVGEILAIAGQAGGGAFERLDIVGNIVRGGFQVAFSFPRPLILFF